MENTVTFKINELPAKPEGCFRIPEANWPMFQERLGKLNRRATKLGMPAVGCTTIREFYVEWQERVEICGEFDHFRTVRTRMTEVQVSGVAPKLQGWEFVATVQHLEAGNLLRTVPGFAGTVPEEFRTADPTRCDHCHTARQRTDTYVLRSETGSWKQVGRQCLRDFLGHSSPEAVAQWCEILVDLDARFADCEGGSGLTRGERYYPLAEVLLATQVCGRIWGWVSRKAAQAAWEERHESIATTKDTMVTFLTGTGRVAKEMRAEAEDKKDERDADLAVAAAAWAAGLENPQTDFEWNIRTVANSEMITTRTFGLATAIIFAYRRKLELDANRAAKAQEVPSVHFGVVGKRAEYLFTVVATTTFDGQFGTTTLVSFVTPEGNRAKWFASGAVENDWEKGKTYKVKATVKDHTEYKGRLETAVNRVAKLAEVA